MSNNVSEFTPQCCTTQPVQSDYIPTGTRFNLKDDLDCYIVGDKSAKAAIIYIYDIFHFHPNAFQGADILANSGFRVIMPDFLRKTSPTAEMLANMPLLMDWFEKKGSYQVLEDDFSVTKKYISETEGFSNVFLVGFCWGGKMVPALSAHDTFYKAGALIHPSALVIEDFEKAQCPMILLPSKDERDFTEEFAVLKAKPFGHLCYQKRYDNMKHGWCASRSEWADPEIAEQANDAFSVVVSAFKSMI